MKEYFVAHRRRDRRLGGSSILPLAGFPVLAMLLGAWIASGHGGDGAAAALGAMAGFLATLVAARVATALPAPRPIPLPTHFQPETYHDR